MMLPVLIAQIAVAPEDAVFAQYVHEERAHSAGWRRGGLP